MAHHANLFLQVPQILVTQSQIAHLSPSPILLLCWPPTSSFTLPEVKVAEISVVSFSSTLSHTVSWPHHKILSRLVFNLQSSQQSPRTLPLQILSFPPLFIAVSAEWRDILISTWPLAPLFLLCREEYASINDSKRLLCLKWSLIKK